MPQTDRTKCLLVDDVEENLIALEALLQRDGLDILKAPSGPEALELLLAHDDVALALLDVQMPEMNGFELAELIRGSERTRHIPLIFMTAGSREQNWQFRGYESGAVDFLYKPIDPHMLTNKASVFFELHRRKQALAHELLARTEALRINELFMAVLSHDLRTPLQSIVAAATVLKREPPARQGRTDGRPCSGREPAHGPHDRRPAGRDPHPPGRRLALQLGPAHMQTVVQRTLDEAATSHPERGIESILEGDLAGHLGHRAAMPGGHQLGRQRTAPWQRRPAGAHLRRWQPSGDREHHGFERWHHPARTGAPHLFDAFCGRDANQAATRGWAWGVHCAPDRAGAPRCHRGQVTETTHDLPGDVAPPRPRTKRRRLTPIRLRQPEPSRAPGRAAQANAVSAANKTQRSGSGEAPRRRQYA